MKKLVILIIFCSLFISNKGFSQMSYFSASYSMGFASGDLSDYITKGSFRGGDLQYRGYVSNNIVAGVDVGWNVFYERMDYATYTQGNISLSGVQYRYSNQLPILVAADYLLKPGERINPYVGFGLGTMYTGRETDMGVYSTEENVWHFTIKPEVGILIEFNQAMDLKVSAKYITGFKTENLPTQSYYSINIGFAFKQY